MEPRQKKQQGANLVSHDGLFDGGKVLERRKKYVTPFGTADIFDEATQLLAQGHKHLILVLDRLCMGGLAFVLSIAMHGESQGAYVWSGLGDVTEHQEKG